MGSISIKVSPTVIPLSLPTIKTDITVYDAANLNHHIWRTDGSRKFLKIKLCQLDYPFEIGIGFHVKTLWWTDLSCQLSTWGCFILPSHHSGWDHQGYVIPPRVSQPVPAWGQCMYWAYLCWLFPISWQYPSHHSMGRVMRSDRCPPYNISLSPTFTAPFPRCLATPPDSYQYGFQQSCRGTAE